MRNMGRTQGVAFTHSNNCHSITKQSSLTFHHFQNTHSANHSSSEPVTNTTDTDSIGPEAQYSQVLLGRCHKFNIRQKHELLRNKSLLRN